MSWSGILLYTTTTLGSETECARFTHGLISEMSLVHGSMSAGSYFAITCSPISKMSPTSTLAQRRSSSSASSLGLTLRNVSILPLIAKIVDLTHSALRPKTESSACSIIPPVGSGVRNLDGFCTILLIVVLEYPASGSE